MVCTTTRPDELRGEEIIQWLVNNPDDRCYRTLDEYSLEFSGKLFSDLNDLDLGMFKRYISYHLEPEWKEIHLRSFTKTLVRIFNDGNKIIDPTTGIPYKIYNTKSKNGGHGYSIITGKSVETGRTFIAQVHQLVADAFIPNPNPEILTQINHIDGDPWHNGPWNLEWCDGSYNVWHSINVLKHQHLRPYDSYDRGEDNAKAAITNDQARQVCRYLSMPEYQALTFKEISKLTGVSEPIITGIHRGITWRSISKDYDFLNRKTDAKKGLRGENNLKSLYSDAQVNQVCAMIQKLTDDGMRRLNIDAKRDISEKTGVSVRGIEGIWYGENREDILSRYPWYNDKMRRGDR